MSDVLTSYKSELISGILFIWKTGRATVRETNTLSVTVYSVLRPIGHIA